MMNDRFFQQNGQSQPSKVNLDVSFRQDGYLRALALTIVDAVIDHSFESVTAARLLVDRLKETFPDSVPEATHATSVETLSLMVTTPQKASRTVIELTWVLRQLAVDTMVQSPINYLPAFHQQGDVIPPSEMRKQAKEVDMVGLTALANQLNLTVWVHETEYDKPIHASRSYGHGDVVVHIDEQDGRFTPRVAHKDVFRPLASIAPVELDLPINSFQDDNTVKQVKALLSRIQFANQENAQWLVAMQQDGGLTQDHLLQQFVLKAAQITWQAQFAQAASVVSEMLVHAVANMISFGITSREAIFEEDARQTTTPTMAI